MQTTKLTCFFLKEEAIIFLNLMRRESTKNLTQNLSKTLLSQNSPPLEILINKNPPKRPLTSKKKTKRIFRM